jgi:hypothetical protein
VLSVPEELERSICDDYNKRFVYVRERSRYYDLEAKQWLTEIEIGRRCPDRLKTPVKGQNPKTISVWLNSRFRNEVDRVGFAPGEPPMYKMPDGDTGLNLWTGWRAESGDIQPFLDLNNAIFSRLGPDLRDFPLKTAAFHAQKTSVKVSYAIYLLGSGASKDLWTRCVMEAFSPWSAQINARHMRSSGFEWAERCAVAALHEATECLRARIGRDSLTQFVISRDLPVSSGRKRAPIGQKNTTLVLMTGQPGSGEVLNDVADRYFLQQVSEASHDILDACQKWLDGGGASRLMHYLLEADLGQWTPPSTAPETADRYLARIERLGPIGRLAEDMKHSTTNTIAQWITESLTWARLAVENGGRQAQTAKEMLVVLPQMQIRPWYTAEELCGIFPHMAFSLLGVDYKVWSPGWLSQHLRKNGIEHLAPADDPRGFLWRGRWRQFLVVADRDKWREPLTQAEFDELITKFPRFSGM